VTSWSQWRRRRFWVEIVLAVPVGVAAFVVVIELPLEPAGELNGCGCAHLHLCRWLGISTREVLD
jgi:hypothetical protein